MCLWVDDDGEWTPLSDGWRTARKQHACMECSRTIEPGERYRFWTGVSDGYMYTGKACAHCMATLDVGNALTGCPMHWNAEQMWDDDPDVGFAANILHDDGHALTAEEISRMQACIDGAKAKWRNPDGSLMPVPSWDAGKGAAA